MTHTYINIIFMTEKTGGWPSLLYTAGFHTTGNQNHLNVLYSMLCEVYPVCSVRALHENRPHTGSCETGRLHNDPINTWATVFHTEKRTNPVDRGQLIHILFTFDDNYWNPDGRLNKRKSAALTLTNRLVKCGNLQYKWIVLIWRAERGTLTARTYCEILFVTLCSHFLCNHLLPAPLLPANSSLSSLLPAFTSYTAGYPTAVTLSIQNSQWACKSDYLIWKSGFGMFNV